jgi:hypothetical protein
MRDLGPAHRSQRHSLLLAVLCLERACVVVLQPPAVASAGADSSRAAQRVLSCAWLALVLRLLALSSAGCASRAVHSTAATALARRWAPLVYSACAIAELELLRSRWLTLLAVFFSAAMLLRRPPGSTRVAAGGAGLLALSLSLLQIDPAGTGIPGSTTAGGAFGALLFNRPAAVCLCGLLACSEAHSAWALLYAERASLCRLDLLVGGVAGAAFGWAARSPVHALALSVVFWALALLQMAWDDEAAAAAAQGHRLTEYRLLSPQYRAQRLLEDDLEEGGFLDHDPYYDSQLS